MTTRQPQIAGLNLRNRVGRILESLDVVPSAYDSGDRLVHSPINGECIGRVADTSRQQALAAIGAAHEAFLQWRNVPAPRRGEFVRLFGDELRSAKVALGELVTIEVGKIASEGLGEVQEMIDICDLAVGLSRQLSGLTMPSERENHRLMEQWHPAGVVGVISAFNFPVAVWSWNAALSLICGNAVVWKPSEKAPLAAIAVSALLDRTMAKFRDAPRSLVSLLIGDKSVGEVLVDDPRVPIVSATGSTAMGRIVGQKVAARFGRSILELGGNNATIVAASADLELALRAIAFSAMGTAGQRCTSLRRLIVHNDVYDRFVPRLRDVYSSVSIGNPLDEGMLVGPLIDRTAFDNMQRALGRAKELGGKVYGGERYPVAGADAAVYVRPALVEMPAHNGPVLEETFAPILYVVKYRDFEDAIKLQNGVRHGLSSSLFTTDLREADRYLSSVGSDCGIANINMGTSGAEIGGAFGGEKETGGGRESGSDTWKGYMRRMTSAINYGHAMPLAQGVTFNIEDNELSKPH